jgi:hypothetical protein
VTSDFAQRWAEPVGWEAGMKFELTSSRRIPSDEIDVSGRRYAPVRTFPNAARIYGHAV